jgi:hypothetical protein
LILISSFSLAVCECEASVVKLILRRFFQNQSQQLWTTNGHLKPKRNSSNLSRRLRLIQQTNK